MAFYTVKSHLVASGFMIFSTTISLFCIGLFLVGVISWTDNEAIINTIGWSFFGYQIKVDGIFIATINLYLGLQGVSVEVVGNLKEILGDTILNSYKSYSSCDNISCTYCYIAGKVAFGLVLISLIFSFVLFLMSVLRFFKNSLAAKVVAIGSAIISFATSLGAFTNWNVNCYLYWRDNFQSSLVLSNAAAGITVTKYEYIGFSVVTAGFVLTFINMVLHILAPIDSIPTSAVPTKAPIAPKVNSSFENGSQA